LQLHCNDAGGGDADGSSPERKARSKQPERHKRPERKEPEPGQRPEHKVPEPHRGRPEHKAPERSSSPHSSGGDARDAGGSSWERTARKKPEHKRPERKVPEPHKQPGRKELERTRAPGSNSYGNEPSDAP